MQLMNCNYSDGLGIDKRRRLGFNKDDWGTTLHHGDIHNGRPTILMIFGADFSRAWGFLGGSSVPNTSFLGCLKMSEPKTLGFSTKVVQSDLDDFQYLHDRIEISDPN